MVQDLNTPAAHGEAPLFVAAQYLEFFDGGEIAGACGKSIEYMQKLWEFLLYGGCTGIYGFVFFWGDQLQVRLGSSTLAKQTFETYHETEP